MKLLPVPLFLGAFFVSPVFGQSSAKPEDVAFFEQKVRPVLIEHCFACHSVAAKQHKGGLYLDSREALLKGGDTGPAAVVGEPAKSLLISAIHYKDTDLQMPPKGKLQDRDRANLEEWVRKGLVFPGSTPVANPEKKIDIAAGKQFWSFLPVKEIQPPMVQNTAWPKQRIDSFILAELEKRKLLPNHQASRVALIRRAKFNLLGLPPTPEEVADFEKDTSPTAFAQRVDQWLNQPQYGERWGRYWLDLVRYCDISEQWSESKGNPYYYRDWVVKAINQDVPYSRFLQLQLAADQIPDATPEDRAALGFIGLSPTYWKELQLPVEIIKTIVSDEYEERIHTLSSTIFGLNMACARCHDHKFDPITAEDYYALAGVLASTKQADQALVSGVVGEKIVAAREEVTKLEAEVKKLSAKKEKEPNPKIAELQAQITKLKQIPGYDAPLAPAVRDASLRVVNAIGTHGSRVIYEEKPQDMPLEIRGNPNKPGPVVSRRFVSVLSRRDPVKFTQGSGRRELSEAMINESGSLVARVFVNRVWKQHFGVGLVETPSDFGKQGDRPSHPELLDDLAARFIAKGWSLKWLHREIMLSASYQQASGPALPEDAEFRYYSRFPRRRLDIEAWRDSLLFVTGTLDQTIGGPPAELSLATNRRRTIYGMVRRRELTDLLRLHDFPDPITHSPTRLPTITPFQQLFTLNSPLMAEQSSALVNRLQADVGPDSAKRIERAYQLLFNRQPTSDQLKIGLAFVQPNDARVWQQYAQVLLGSNEFQFVD